MSLVELGAAALGAGGLAGAVKGWFSPGDQAAGSARRRERDRDRSPAWARPADIPDLLVRGPVPARVHLGLLAGRPVANPPRRSVLVQAPTGGGKTPRVAVPTVLRHAGPAVVASVKADVLQLTRTARARSGPVWVFPTAVGRGGLSELVWEGASSHPLQAGPERLQ